MISYLIRYNWSLLHGLVKPQEDYEGIAYKDFVGIPLDEIEEHTLAICKHYNISYEYAVNQIAYTDISVLYAKMSNEKAFSSYCDFINLDEQSRSKQVMDFGEVKPYVFDLITPEVQKEQIDKIERSKLSEMYRSGGKFIND